MTNIVVYYPLSLLLLLFFLFFTFENIRSNTLTLNPKALVGLFAATVTRDGPHLGTMRQV